MRAWEIVSETLKFVVSNVKVGVTTNQLDKLAEDKIIELGGRPFNKGYFPKWSKTPFPSTLCCSVNDVIVHGIPSEYALREGDIINLDLGVEKDGECGDAAMSLGVGQISNRDERLLYYAKKTLYEAIKILKAGVSTKDISRTIETYAGLRGYVVNTRYGGHGIGKEMHEEPPIFNATFPEMKEEFLKAGQMICIEPLLTYKDRLGVLQDDGWMLKTRDRRRSAFYEHQVLITEQGYEILTTHIKE